MIRNKERKNHILLSISLVFITLVTSLILNSSAQPAGNNLSLNIQMDRPVKPSNGKVRPESADNNSYLNNNEAKKETSSSSPSNNAEICSKGEGEITQGLSLGPENLGSPQNEQNNPQREQTPITARTSIGEQQAEPRPTSNHGDNSSTPSLSNRSQISSVLSEISRGGNTQILDLARKKQEQIRNNAQSDLKTLSSSYDHVNIDNMDDYLSRAQSRLRNATQQFGKVESGADEGDLTNALHAKRNALDLTRAARSILHKDKRKIRNNQLNPLRKLSSPDSNPLVKTPGLKELFGVKNPLNDPNSPDGQALREILFEGLEQNQRQNVSSDLDMAHQFDLKLNDGSEFSPYTQSTGFILGAKGKKLVDCSSFVTQALPPRLRRLRFSTLDFYGIYHYLMSGKTKFPDNLEFPADREKTLKKLSTAFESVEVNSSAKAESYGVFPPPEEPKPGDLLVFRHPKSSWGHVMLVKSYNPKNGTAKVMDASQSAGTIRETSLPIFVTGKNGNKGVLKGLMGLRLKTGNSTKCESLASR